LARTPVRLIVLLGLLVAVAAYGIPTIIHKASASNTSGCSTGAVPVTLRSSLTGVESTLAGGLKSLVRPGSVDVQGLQEPTSAWSDVPPSAPSAASSAPDNVDAGYEIRWWSIEQDHQAVDEFVFGGSREASLYVRQAASVRCRDHAAAYRLAQPAGGRALIWTNPDGVREADVFFSRGSRAYRLVDVPPSTYLEGPLRLDAQELIGPSQSLACRLAHAECERPSTGPALSAAGYDGLRLLAAAEGQLRFEPPERWSTVISRACVIIARFSDPEARLLYETCQAFLHFLTDEAYARRCFGSGPCQQWAINTAAGDMHRLADIERQLAAQLTIGACRAGWNQDATSHDQLGEAFLAFGHAIALRRPRIRRLDRSRALLLSREAQQHNVTPFEFLSSCAPHGALLGPPSVA
jgi:hypothetical protein